METNEYKAPATSGVSFEERFAALEHQCYLMYLQLNAITQLLVDGGTLEKENIGKQMDGMHNEIIQAVEELQTQAAAPAAEGEVVDPQEG